MNTGVPFVALFVYSSPHAYNCHGSKSVGSFMLRRMVVYPIIWTSYTGRFTHTLDQEAWGNSTALGGMSYKFHRIQQTAGMSYTFHDGPTGFMRSSYTGEKIPLDSEERDLLVSEGEIYSFPRERSTGFRGRDLLVSEGEIYWFRERHTRNVLHAAVFGEFHIAHSNNVSLTTHLKSPNLIN
jgi:hypothetical protein